MAAHLPRPRTRHVALAISVPFLIALAVLTLWPARVENAAPEAVGSILLFFQDGLVWIWMSIELLEMLSNVALFIPVGVLAALVLPHRVWALSFLVAPVVSAAIEITQLTALPDRAATVQDVVLNTAGGAIGVALALLGLWVSWFRSGRPSSPTLEAS